jgi:hypothetical protein
MGFTMQGWQKPFLGIHELPRDISDFEIKAFITFKALLRQQSHLAAIKRLWPVRVLNRTIDTVKRRIIGLS